MRKTTGLFRRGARKTQEALEVGMLLALVGGFLDAYSYLLRGGVFANAQTGNLVLLGINLAQFNWARVSYYIAPIIAFIAGAIVSEVVRRTVSNKVFLHWTQVALLCESALLFGIGFFNADAVPHAVVNVTISFVCAVQVCAFKKIFGVPYATTMCTGNLRSATEQACAFFYQKDKEAGHRALSYLLVIIMFCTGAAAGVACVNLWAEKSIWVCCILLIVVFFVMLYDERSLSRQ